MSSQLTQSKTIRAQLLASMKMANTPPASASPGERFVGAARHQPHTAVGHSGLWNGEGFITRRHGVGTIINRHVLNADPHGH